MIIIYAFSDNFCPPSRLNIYIPSPGGGWPNPHPTDRERSASAAQAAEGFREWCVQSEIATTKTDLGVDSCNGEEDTCDEVFVAMHAPYVTFTHTVARKLLRS